MNGEIWRDSIFDRRVWSAGAEWSQRARWKIPRILCLWSQGYISAYSFVIPTMLWWGLREYVGGYGSMILPNLYWRGAHLWGPEKDKLRWRVCTGLFVFSRHALGASRQDDATSLFLIHLHVLTSNGQRTEQFWAITHQSELGSDSFAVKESTDF